MRDKHTLAREFDKILDRAFFRGRSRNHFVGNARKNTSFIRAVCERQGLDYPFRYVDTLALSRAALPHLKVLNSSTTSILRSFTAPISVIRSVFEDIPVVSKSNTMISSFTG